MRHLPAAALLAAAALLTAGCATTTSSQPDATASTIANLPVPAPTPDEAAINDALVGLTVAAADSKTSDAGYTLRVVSVNGTPSPATMDYNPTRINVDVDNGIVTRATVG